MCATPSFLAFKKCIWNRMSAWWLYKKNAYILNMSLTIPGMYVSFPCQPILRLSEMPPAILQLNLVQSHRWRAQSNKTSDINQKKQAMQMLQWYVNWCTLMIIKITDWITHSLSPNCLRFWLGCTTRLGDFWDSSKNWRESPAFTGLLKGQSDTKEFAGEEAQGASWKSLQHKSFYSGGYVHMGVCTWVCLLIQQLFKPCT